MLVFIGQFVGAGLNLISPLLTAMYNNPSAQVRRLKKAGFSKNAMFKLANTGTMQPPSAVDFSADFGQADVRKTKKETDLLGIEAQRETDLNEWLLQPEVVSRSVSTLVQSPGLKGQQMNQSFDLKTGRSNQQAMQKQQYDIQQKGVEGAGIDVAQKSATLTQYWELSDSQINNFKANAKYLGVRTDNEQALKQAYISLQEQTQSMGALGDLLMMFLLGKQR